MPELTPQSEAAQIATLAAWVGYETSFRALLTDAGCTDQEARLIMRAEEN